MTSLAKGKSPEQYPCDSQHSDSFLEIWEGHHQGYKEIILGMNSDFEASILLAMITKLSMTCQSQRRQKTDLDIGHIFHSSIFI